MLIQFDIAPHNIIAKSEVVHILVSLEGSTRDNSAGGIENLKVGIAQPIVTAISATGDHNMCDLSFTPP